jgi:hypothetical protein
MIDLNISSKIQYSRIQKGLTRTKLAKNALLFTDKCSAGKYNQFLE